MFANTLCEKVSAALYLGDVYGPMNGALVTAANGVLRYTFRRCLLALHCSEYLVSISACLVAVSDSELSVRKPRHRMGYVPSRLRRHVTAAHTVGLLQVGTEYQTEEQAGGNGMIARTVHRATGATCMLLTTANNFLSPSSSSMHTLATDTSVS